MCLIFKTAASPAQFRKLALGQPGVGSTGNIVETIAWRSVGWQNINSPKLPVRVLSAVSFCFTLNCLTWPLPSYSIGVLCHHWGSHRWSQTGCNKLIHYAKTKFDNPVFAPRSLLSFHHATNVANWTSDNLFTIKIVNSKIPWSVACGCIYT